jgi:transposase
VAPASGETVWYLSNGINKPFFAELLKAFARTTGAGRERIIILALDNAGWHGPQNLPVPEGVRLVYQPAYSPELQPAEHLWPLVDEPLVNRYFDTIDDLDVVVAQLLRAAPGSTNHQQLHQLPLVAKTTQAELITRKWYDI